MTTDSSISKCICKFQIKITPVFSWYKDVVISSSTWCVHVCGMPHCCYRADIPCCHRIGFISSHYHHQSHTQEHIPVEFRLITKYFRSKLYLKSLFQMAMWHRRVWVIKDVGSHSYCNNKLVMFVQWGTPQYNRTANQAQSVHRTLW